MQVRTELVFVLKKPMISLDYRRMILSWLKLSLTECNQGKYYERYFRLDAPQKDYCFTVLMDSPKFTKEKILLKEPRIRVIFSADDKNRSGLIFFAAFLAMKNKQFPLPDENAMTLRNVIRRNEALIAESSVIFRTSLGNGLCIREHNRETNRDKFFTCEDPEFREKTEEILKIQAKLAGYPESMVQTIKFTPIQCKKVLVFFYGRYVDVTTGILQLEGEPELLQYFYLAGAGSKHSAGFGQLNILK